MMSLRFDCPLCAHALNSKNKYCDHCGLFVARPSFNPGAGKPPVATIFKSLYKESEFPPPPAGALYSGGTNLDLTPIPVRPPIPKVPGAVPQFSPGENLGAFPHDSIYNVLPPVTLIQQSDIESGFTLSSTVTVSGPVPSPNPVPNPEKNPIPKAVPAFALPVQESPAIPITIAEPLAAFLASPIIAAPPQAVTPAEPAPVAQVEANVEVVRPASPKAGKSRYHTRQTYRPAPRSLPRVLVKADAVANAQPKTNEFWQGYDLSAKNGQPAEPQRKKAGLVPMAFLFEDRPFQSLSALNPFQDLRSKLNLHIIGSVDFGLALLMVAYCGGVVLWVAHLVEGPEGGSVQASPLADSHSFVPRVKGLSEALPRLRTAPVSPATTVPTAYSGNVPTTAIPQPTVSVWAQPVIVPDHSKASSKVPLGYVTPPISTPASDAAREPQEPRVLTGHKSLLAAKTPPSAEVLKQVAPKWEPADKRPWSVRMAEKRAKLAQAAAEQDEQATNIAEYNRLLAGYFSKKSKPQTSEEPPPEGLDGGVAEPPALDEWMKQGKPQF